MRISKRRRFLITSAVLASGFVILQLIGVQYRFIGISLMGLFTVVLFIFSLWEGLGRNATLITLMLPLAFTVSVGLFWFLLPVGIFIQIFVLIFYGLGIYILCLTANIYTVSAIRTIALLRAAHGVGFILTLMTLFFIYDTILSLHSVLLIRSLLILFSTLPLMLHGLWSITLDKVPTLKTLLSTVVFSIIIMQVSILLFFWPVTIVVGSLFLTTFAYILLGLGQAELESRLFNSTIREYLAVGIAVFIGMIIATRWS